MVSTTLLGKKIKIRLVELDQSQQWLIDKIKEKRPDKYIDHSLLNKLMIGEFTSKPLSDAICEILGIDYE